MSHWFEKETQILIPGPAGQLEAIINGQPTQTTINEVAIVCHPHPLHEGTMHNKVVHTLMRLFRDRGTAVVRFNYRGVQGSQGGYGEGVGECEDLGAVIDYVQAQLPHADLTLCGFSFGGYIAAQGAENFYRAGGALTKLIMVAPSVVHFDFSHLSLSFVDKIVVQAVDDDIVPHSGVTAMYETLAEPKQFIEFDQAGHFFHGKLGTLKQRIEACLL